MAVTEQKKPFDVNRAAAQEWILTWRTATPEDLGELEEIADVEGVKAVEDGKAPPVCCGIRNAAC